MNHSRLLQLFAPGLFAVSGVFLSAQSPAIYVEAESGSTVPSSPPVFATLNDPGGFTFVRVQEDFAATAFPGTDTRVLTFTVTFPEPGVYNLYLRLRVGPASFNDDSFYYGNGFGVKPVDDPNAWILVNGLASGGFTLPADRVVGGGFAGSNVWKWIRLSDFSGQGEPGVQFTVTPGALTQTFQIGSRENGLDFDRFAFGQAFFGPDNDPVFYTVADLDTGQPGTTVPPPPPFDPPGPPIATDHEQFLGSAYSPAQTTNFDRYWNQVTPENAGKWGSVEGTRDQMNWGPLDEAYNFAKANGFVFRYHVLVWGAQQPNWIENLPPAEQLEEIEEWFQAVAERYPGIDWVEVVNEPLHDPPAIPPNQPGTGAGNYRAALELYDPTETGEWAWLINAFKIARKHFVPAEPFPDAFKLMLNEFSVTNTDADMERYVEIVQQLQARGLIDAVGVQGHAFSTRPNIPMATHQANLDLLAMTGLPIQVTEFDIDGPTDEIQLADYMRVFPVFWEHPSMTGITLWGFRPGHWRTAQGAYIVHENGAERPAMQWLQEYVRNDPPTIVTQPLDVTVRMGGTATFSVAASGPEGLGRPYQWFRNGVLLPGETSPTLTIANVQGADIGSYHVLVTNGGGSVASESVMLAIADIALVRHAPLLNRGIIQGSLQQMQGENVTFNSGMRVFGSLFVPGQPTVRLNGNPNLGEVLDGSGDVAPMNYTVTLNSNVTLDRIVRRTDAVALPVVSAPDAPAGTRSVLLNSSGQSVGDWSTVRNLTVNHAGAVEVPAGTYGAFIANAGRLVLGTPGAIVPSLYQFQSLTLNGSASVDVVGPVIVVLAQSFTVNGGGVGNPAQPEWLELNVANGGVTLNSGADLSGYVSAPAGSVVLNQNTVLRGGLAAGRLTLNGGQLLLTAPVSSD